MGSFPMGEPGGGGVGGSEVIRIFLPLSSRLENYEYEYINDYIGFCLFSLLKRHFQSL